MKLNKIKIYITAVFTIALFLLPISIVKAETASAISFGTIDYEDLTMQVYNNSNTIVYYSTDNITGT